MANLKNDVKFDSGGECKDVCICAPKYDTLQQHSTLKTLTRINYNRSVCVNKTSD